MEVGRSYRHEGTGRVFVVRQISLMENPIEGGIAPKITLEIVSDPSLHGREYSVGPTQVERWWPKLTDVTPPPDEPEEEECPSCGESRVINKHTGACDACSEAAYSRANPR